MIIHNLADQLNAEGKTLYHMLLVLCREKESYELVIITKEFKTDL